MVEPPDGLLKTPSAEPYALSHHASAHPNRTPSRRGAQRGHRLRGTPLRRDPGGPTS